MSSSMGRIIPYIMENKKCSKPPITYIYIYLALIGESWVTYNGLQLLHHNPVKITSEKQDEAHEPECSHVC